MKTPAQSTNENPHIADAVRRRIIKTAAATVALVGAPAIVRA